MRPLLILVLAVALALLALVVAYARTAGAAVIETMFYGAVLALVIFLLWLAWPRR